MGDDVSGAPQSVLLSAPLTADVNTMALSPGVSAGNGVLFWPKGSAGTYLITASCGVATTDVSGGLFATPTAFSAGIALAPASLFNGLSYVNATAAPNSYGANYTWVFMCVVVISDNNVATSFQLQRSGTIVTTGGVAWNGDLVVTQISNAWA